MLRGLGCDVAQGYFLAHPLEPTALARWTAEWAERWPLYAPECAA